MSALTLGATSTNRPKSWPNRTFDKFQQREQRQIESTVDRMQSSLPRPRRPPRPPPASLKMANLWLIQQVLLATVAMASGQLHDLSQLQRRSTDAEVLRGGQGAGCQAQTMGHLAQQLQQDGQQQQQDQSAPSLQVNSKKLFCFYDIQDDFRPQDLNPCLCTHVVYSYVAVRRNLSFIAGKKGDLRSLASLKRKNPHLKLLVSLRPDDFFSFDSLQTVPLGSNQHQQATPLVNLPPEQTDGANSSLAPGAESLRHHQPASTSDQNVTLPTTGGVVMNEMHQKFAKRIRDFIVRHSLDGINLDWPYFAQIMASGSPRLQPNETREHLTLILQAMNENFQLSWSQSSPSAAYLRQQAPIVTLTVSKDFYSLVDGYNFHQINSLIDFVYLPAFDFDLNVDQYSIGHPARLHGIYDAENLDTLVDLLLSSGLPSDQLIAGIPTHGVQITSKPPTTTTSVETNGTKEVDLSDQLEAAANISIVSHSEVCRVRDLARQNCSTNKTNQLATCWTMSRSRDLTAPFAYDSEHWIGFDDETSVKLKAKYSLLRHLAGVAMFTVNNDDPAGQCGFGPYPLLTTINGVLSRTPSAASTGGLLRHHQKSANNQRGSSFTRAPNQLLTATSLVSQIFSSSSRSTGSNRAVTPSQQHDLMSSASDEMPANHRANSNQIPSAHLNTGPQPLMSFVDIIEKYGAVNRLDQDGRAQSASSQADEDLDQLLPCDKVGYQRYPRDCSRFYRCVQTPPQANSNGAISKPVVASSRQLEPTNTSARETLTNQNHATTSITRLQYECPSGLVFDEQYQICNWPSWSAQCTGSGEVNSITSTKFVCPNYGYFQNQENCEYFYYCSDYNRGATTQAYQFRCPFELGFDEEKLQCNWKWLVKGCSVKQPPDEAVSLLGRNETNFEMAKKYLSTLENSATATTTLAPVESSSQSSRADQSNTTIANAVPTAAPTTIQVEFEPSRTTNASSSSDPSPVPQLSRRSLELDDPPAQSRAFVPAFSSHLTSLMASIEAIRQHRLKKANSNGVGEVQKTKQRIGPAATTKSETTTSASPMAETKPVRYPSFVGTFPQQANGQAAVSGSGGGDQSQGQSFRRRQTSGGGGDKQSSVSASNPYKRRPPPASIFPFLPNSAVYMVADSLRSYGEAISDELNRYLRLAGDRMRDVLGHRPAKVSGPRRRQQVSSSRFDETKISRLAQLARRLTRGQSSGQRRLSLNDVDRRQDVQQQLKRVRRDIMSSDGQQADGDLVALESGPAPIVQQQNQQYQQRVYQQPAYNHRDSLGRPPGYPLNTLDEEAKRAVIGPEPKMFHQPQALVLNQLSGISQHDYELLMRGHAGGQVVRRPPAQQHWSVELGDEQMMSAASEQVLPSVAFAAPPVSQQQQPFGMPTIIRPVQSDLAAGATSNGPLKANNGKQRRRSTVAMKLAASLALPKFTSTTTTSLPPTTGNNKASNEQTSSKGYMSFLPSFTDVVAPARNIMNKAMGPFNRAVQELISTLSPSSSSNSKQPRPTLPIRMPTTPMPTTTIQQQQQQHQANNQIAHFRPAMMQQQQQQYQANIPSSPQSQPQQNKNRTNGPLLLTEDEARALSAQLDQLSKEQLETLSNDMFKQQPKQQMVTSTTAAAAATTTTTNGQESPDYVVRLLKMLSQTSHNPEDIKLLDQLANSVNNPKPSGADQSLIEIGQPDDLALLEALGMIPASQRPNSGDQLPSQQTAETKNGSGPMRGHEQDNQPEASYSNYQQHQLQQQQFAHEMMKPGAMRPLLEPLQAKRQMSQQDQQRRHQFRPAANHPPLEISTGFDTTTKLVPVTLNYDDPTSTYSPMDQQRQYNTNYYTTTTTTTTPQPTELVTRLVQEQSLERVVPPVRQTFSEIIENNVTTPDGIETIIESRTKTAISGGASFDISSQLGLGMIPGAFGGSLPDDSPLSQQQRSLAALEKEKLAAASLINSTDSTVSLNSTKEANKTSGNKTTTTKTTTTKTSSAIKLNSGSNLQQVAMTEGNSFLLQQQRQQLSQQQQQALLLAGMSGQRISSTSTTDQLLQEGAQRPLTSRTVTSSFSNARSQPNSVPATLSGYNFATQPVNQYEEVVIRKKFKPFPKTMIVPQESSFTVEEVHEMPTTIQQQADFNQQQQQFNIAQQQQQQQQHDEKSATAQFGSSGGSNSAFGSSSANAVTSQEQIKEDEFSTIASTFGEQPPATTTTTPATNQNTFNEPPITTSGGVERESLTSQELRQDQQQVAKDLQSIGQLLRVQEEAQLNGGGSLSESQPLDGDSPKGLVENVNLSESMDELRKLPKTSRKSKNKSQRQRSATTTTTTPAPSTTTTPIESSTAKRSVDQEEGASESSGGSRDRVEKAFTNFMVELKRTRKPSGKNGTTTTTTTTTTSTTTSTTTTSKPQTGGDPKRKSRSKKQKQKNDLESSGSMRQSTQQHVSKQRRLQRTQQRQQQSDQIRQKEQVAVYGTKSGFMPIIRPDDPNYSDQLQRNVNEQQRQVYDNSLAMNSDPLSFGASFTSSKHAKLPATGQELRSNTKKQRNLGANSANRKRKQQEMSATNDSNNNSWRQYFVRRLSDQISVVHLGNCSERINTNDQLIGSRVIQVKLVILPASPNNQLLSEKNWQHLAANYPQLFPRDLQELNTETIDLGKTSINLSNGGLIDEHAEQRRHSEFKSRYEFVSQLIEPRTFKALDEIIQRSSGQMFMIQRKDSLDRTIIAVIPDRPFIRTAMSPSGGYQRLVIPPSSSSATSNTTAPPVRQLNKLKASNKISTQTPPLSPSSTTTMASQPLDQLSQSPQKAATFSRAIQESIQEAIKQHYDTVKSQLRQSMQTTTTTDNPPQQQAWSTPAPETLAHMESVVQVHHQAPPAAATQTAAAADPMETASSSTEYSVVMSESNKLQLPSSGYSQQAVFEVEGAEPKALYGLDLTPSNAPLKSSNNQTGEQNSESKLSHAASKREKSSTMSHFISIGSHLIASPMKKIVDQAYVNHFYDHISGHQLAKSIGFDELVDEPIDRQLSNVTTLQQEQQQQQTTHSNESQNETDHQLVPESACTRAGLFQHPFACNKFYECFWDKQLAKYTLHMFECPIKLAFDERITGCAMPIESSLCVNAI